MPRKTNRQIALEAARAWADALYRDYRDNPQDRGPAFLWDRAHRRVGRLVASGLWMSYRGKTPPRNIVVLQRIASRAAMRRFRKLVAENK